jgi:hypothetical protein
MQRKVIGLAVLLALGVCLTSAPAADPTPASMAAVVRSPRSYVGQELVFPGVTLSGNLTKYTAAGPTMYYMTAETRKNQLEGGFLVADPEIVNSLKGAMNTQQNYTGNIICEVVPVQFGKTVQYLAVVRGVEFLDANGNVINRIKKKDPNEQKDTRKEAKQDAKKDDQKGPKPNGMNSTPKPPLPARSWFSDATAP